METTTRRTFTLDTNRTTEFVDITDRVAAIVTELGLTEGAVVVASQHTTAGITVNEGFDPDVATDVLMALERMVPDEGFQHMEGNSDAHVKVSLVGSSQVIPVGSGRLELGRWQRVFLCEFDGPRSRTVVIRGLQG